MTRHPGVPIARRGLRSVRGEAGVTLIEMLIATVLFLLVASSLATVLTSAINSHRLSRERTLAEQTAMGEIERIRRLNYDDVGVSGGNPPGTLPATQTVDVTGLDATLRIQVSYVNDPTPTSYATSANYKKVTVTVTRAAGSVVLAREVTYIAPPARAPYGGIDKAIINAQVIDFGNNTPVEGVTVNLGTGPSAPRSDATDATGTVTFPALTANPTSGPQAYYDLAVDLPSGYAILPEDVPPGAAAHVQLAPGQTFNTTLRIYRPATISVLLRNPDGSTYTGDAAITVSSPRGSEAFTSSGGALTVTSVNGEAVVPGLEYTVSAETGGGTPATPVTQYVPEEYPTDLTSVFTITFPPTGTLGVAVTWAGVPAAGATVTLTGGPLSISVSGTTDEGGVVTFINVPAGDGYTITATKGGESASQIVSVVEGQTIAIDLTLPLGSVLATVTWASSPVSGATVTLSGGPQSISVSGATDASGVVTFVNVPSGPGYTVTASQSGQSASQTVTVSAGATVDVPIALPTGSIAATVTWNTWPVSGATVTLTGGPMGADVTGTTSSNGTVAFTSVPAGSGYTVTATKNGITGSQAAVVSGGGTTAVAIALSTSGVTTGTLSVTVKRGSSNQSGATVVLSGGPMGITVTRTTNGSGVATFTSIPAGSGYTIKAWKCSVSNPKSVTNSSVTVNAGSNSLTVTFSTNTCPLP